MAGNWMRQGMASRRLQSVIACHVRSARISAKNKPALPPFTPYQFYKPVVFTAAVGASSFAIAAIIDHETKHQSGSAGRRRPFDFGNAIRQGPLTKTRLVELLKAKWNSYSQCEKLAVLVTATNFVVFAGWQLRPLQGFLSRHFLLSVDNAVRRPQSMLLSGLSHSSFIHFFVNSYVLFSFCGALESSLGAPQCAALFTGGIAFSSLASYCHHLRRPNCSLGSSGGIFSLLAFTCLTYPTATMHVAFIDNIIPHSFEALPALLVLMGIDLAGLALGWRTFDHAAHLGGAIFGAAYMLYGNRYFETHREGFVKRYEEVKRIVLGQQK